MANVAMMVVLLAAGFVEERRATLAAHTSPWRFIHYVWLPSSRLPAAGGPVTSTPKALEQGTRFLSTARVGVSPTQSLVPGLGLEYNIAIAIYFWRAVGAIFLGQCDKGSQKLCLLLFIIHNQTPA